MSRSISESPLDFEIMRVHCNLQMFVWIQQFGVPYVCVGYTVFAWTSAIGQIWLGVKMSEYFWSIQ